MYSLGLERRHDSSEIRIGLLLQECHNSRKLGRLTEPRQKSGPGKDMTTAQFCHTTELLTPLSSILFSLQ